MTCNNCQDCNQCPIRNAQIRSALMRHENNPYLDELTKVTPEELQHTNMYKKPWGVDICKKCKKAESQLNEECI